MEGRTAAHSTATRSTTARSTAVGWTGVWWAAAWVVAVASAVLLLVGLAPTDARLMLEDELVGSALIFDGDVLADVAAYRSPRRGVVLASRILALVVPLAAALLLIRMGSVRGGGRPAWLRRLTGVGPVPLQVGMLTAGVVFVTALVRLPLAVWASVVQDGRWGFRTRSVPGWALDHLVLVTGRAVLIGLLAAAFALVVTRHPQNWPARVSVLVAVVGPLMLLMHPLVVHPVLLPTGPMPHGPHRDAVEAVVARSGIEVPVLVGEASRRTTRRNAVATGLGPTRRIVLHDTLLELTPREVAAITAHELAHLERRDPLRGVLAPVPLVLVGGLAARRRIAQATDGMARAPTALAAAVALILAAEVALAPLSAAVSRTVEHRTDVRSVVLSADPQAHVALLRAFVIDGLAEPDPPRWSVLLWATHPTPAQRIRAVGAVEVPGPISFGDEPASTDHATR